MAEARYQNFDVTIQREGKSYRVRVDSPVGEAAGRFRMPFSDLELENFYLNTTPGKRSVRRIDTPEVASAKKYGERLFKAVFTEEVLGRLQSALGEADRNDERLRIRLRLTDVPELTDLPWDYLYNPALNRFLALGNDTALVRYLELPERVRPVTVQLPLKMLVVISSPNDFPQLDVSQEWANLNEALRELVEKELVSVDLLEDATMPELRRRLAKEQYNILHFIGHGAFDRQTEEGVLVFKDENGRGRLVSGQQLGVLTHNHKSLALAVLNACEGAKGDRSDVFAGTAQSLVQQGIPAVVAMQREITDDAAKVFAHAFYSAVAAGNPVEAAMTETRIALYAEELGLEWATPVLYMRAQDGRVFDLQAPVARPVQAMKPVEPPPAPVAREVEVAPLVVMEKQVIAEAPKKGEVSAAVVPSVPVVAAPVEPAKKAPPVVPSAPIDGGDFAKKITANTDEMLRSITADMTQQHGGAAADYAAIALEKAKRETLAENKKSNPRTNNMVLVALGLIGVVAVVVLVVFLLGNNNGGGGDSNNNNNVASEPTATVNLPAGVMDLLATRTAVAGLNPDATPTPGKFRKLADLTLPTDLPANAEADSMVFSENGTLAAVWFFVGSTSEGQNKAKIAVWDVAGGAPITEFNLVGYDRGYTQMAFFPSEGGDDRNRRFAYLEGGLNVRVRHLTDPKFNNDISIENVISFAVSSDGSYLATGLKNGDTIVWSMADLQKYLKVAGHVGRVQSVAYSPFSYVLATTDASNTRVYKDGEDALMYDVSHDLGGGDYFFRTIFAHDGSLFSVCNGDGACEFWQASDGESIGKLTLSSDDKQKYGYLLSASMTLDDKYFVTGWANGIVTYWGDGGVLEQTYSMSVDGTAIRTMAFPFSMGKVGIVGADNSVQIWNLP